MGTRIRPKLGLERPKQAGIGAKNFRGPWTNSEMFWLELAGMEKNGIDNYDCYDAQRHHGYGRDTDFYT